MKQYIYLTIISAALATLVACGKSSTQNPSTNASVQTICPVGQTMTTGGCTVNTMPNGTSFYGMISYKTPVGANNYNNYNNYYFNNTSGYTTFGGYNVNQVGNTLQTLSGYAGFIKDLMGVCDQMHSTGGRADCDTWAAGENAISLVKSSSGGVFIRFYSQSYSNYTYQFPSFSQLLSTMFLGFGTTPEGSLLGTNKIAIEARIAPYNDNAGFVVESFGPKGSLAWNKQIRLLVDQGTMGDNQVSYVLEYDGNNIAQGTLTQCSTPECKQ